MSVNSKVTVGNYGPSLPQINFILSEKVILVGKMSSKIQNLGLEISNIGVICGRM